MSFEPFLATFSTFLIVLSLFGERKNRVKMAQNRAKKRQKIGHFGVIWTIFGSIRIILGSRRDHFGIVLASFGGRFGVVLTPF